MKKSFIAKSVLQKKARQIQNEKSLKWHQALDEASVFYGFTNFKNYQNTAEDNRQQREASKVELLESMSREKNAKISKTLGLANSQIQNVKISITDLLNDLKRPGLSKEAKRAICEKSNLKKYIQLFLLKDFLEDEFGEMDSDAPLHIPKEISLKNLLYKADEDALHIMGEYNLKLEFAFDHEPDDKNEIYDDDKKNGYFDLSIDRDNMISIEDITMEF